MSTGNPSQALLGGRHPEFSNLFSSIGSPLRPEETECIVCKEDFGDLKASPLDAQAQTLTHMHCKYSFHAECLGFWLKNNDTCICCTMRFEPGPCFLLPRAERGRSHRAELHHDAVHAFRLHDPRALNSTIDARLAYEDFVGLSRGEMIQRLVQAFLQSAVGPAANLSAENRADMYLTMLERKMRSTICNYRPTLVARDNDPFGAEAAWNQIAQGTRLIVGQGFGSFNAFLQAVRALDPTRSVSQQLAEALRL